MDYKLLLLKLCQNGFLSLENGVYTLDAVYDRWTVDLYTINIYSRL